MRKRSYKKEASNSNKAYFTRPDGLEKDAKIHGVHSKESQLDRDLYFALVFETGSYYIAQLSLHTRQSSCLGLPLK